MKIGERIRFVRLGVMALPPGFFADLVGVTRADLEEIESGKREPTERELYRISIVTKTARGWYKTGRRSVTLNNWGYFEIPFKGIEKLGGAGERVVQEVCEALVRGIRGSLADAPGDFREYYVAEVKGDKDRFLVVPVGINGIIVFKLGPTVWPSVKRALEEGGAKEANRTTLRPEVASRIGSPREKRTDPGAVIGMFQLLGLEKLGGNWAVCLEDIRKCIWRMESSEYQDRVRKAVDLIGMTGEVKNMRDKGVGYTRDELEAIRPSAWVKELGLEDKEEMQQ
ncbi:MAG: hypothetical protein DRH15_06825 [Deltaproteobacteria bacterium]|nr:MAG: hypothetical protein DRH15_06825 [Deltaproteobacteria bacterium]